jgi:hypothetical protein
VIKAYGKTNFTPDDLIQVNSGSMGIAATREVYGGGAVPKGWLRKLKKGQN